MALNVALLRNSFDLVVARQPKVSSLFYQVLFTRHPQVRPLFKRNAADTQERMLQAALVAVMEHLDDVSWLCETLGALGAKHRDYGVTDEMYDWVGDSLLITLREVAGSDWSPELSEAWSDAYQAIAMLMLRGARSDA